VLRPPLAALLCAGLGSALALAAAAGEAPASAGWPVTGGDPGGSRYSPLREIHRGNVARLEVAWVYRHGDVYDPALRPDAPRHSAFESTPILVDGRLVFSTPFGRVIALDPESGAELWTFDPGLDLRARYANGYVSRGVAHWRDGAGGGPCASRILHATVEAKLIALDALTGRPCPGFGRGGTVDLHEGVTGLAKPSHYKQTSPPVVVGDVVVVGSSLADGLARQPWGGVRGYDARSGRLLWRFNTIPQEGETGTETWERGSWRAGSGANPWAPMSADPERGLVFVPTSTASPDFWGGDRPGANLFADSLVVLRAGTGERVWHYQTLHHDLWDYDVASPPNLVRIQRDGRALDAVVQLTKTGLTFVFERETGRPVFPIEERPVPKSDVPGEWTSPTQPFPTRPPPLAPIEFTEADLWDTSPEHLAFCRDWLRRLRNEGIFTPPSPRGSIIYPSYGGGANWSGGGVDPERGVLYVPVNDVALVVRVVLPPRDGQRRGALARARARLAPWRAPGPRPEIRDERFMRGDEPCKRPPWGSLVAVDLNRGEILWRVPTGRDADGSLGLTSMGPPLVTAGGLVFHAGTWEPRLRAHDAETGAVLAGFELPAGLHAGPITYKLRPEGKQFLVIAPGGHFSVGRFAGSKRGDYVIAYTLPD